MMRSRRGAATIEFALTCALGFVPVTFGLMEFSWYQFQQIQVNTVCQQVIREAAATPIVDDPVAYAEDRLPDALADGTVQGDVNVTAVITGDPPARLLEMTAEVEYRPLILSLIHI